MNTKIIYYYHQYWINPETKKIYIGSDVHEMNAQLGLAAHDAILWAYNRAYKFRRHIISLEVISANY